MSKINVAMSATNCSFTLGRRHNLSMTNFQKLSGVSFGCVADNVFNVFLFLYMLDTNNDVNPELEKSQSLSTTFVVHTKYEKCWQSCVANSSVNAPLVELIGRVDYIVESSKLEVYSIWQSS